MQKYVNTFRPYPIDSYILLLIQLYVFLFNKQYDASMHRIVC